MSSRSGVLDPRRDCAVIARELGRTGEFESVDYPQGYEIESLGPPP